MEGCFNGRKSNLVSVVKLDCALQGRTVYIGTVAAAEIGQEGGAPSPRKGCVRAGHFRVVEVNIPIRRPAHRHFLTCQRERERRLARHDDIRSVCSRHAVSPSDRIVAHVLAETLLELRAYSGGDGALGLPTVQVSELLEEMLELPSVLPQAAVQAPPCAPP
jgi:hypothetical protein